MGTSVPELKNYMDKRLIVHLNGERKIIGVLRGYDSSATEIYTWWLDYCQQTGYELAGDNWTSENADTCHFSSFPTWSILLTCLAGQQNPALSELFLNIICLDEQPGPLMTVFNESRHNGFRALLAFLNIVLEESVEEKANGDKVQAGMAVIRGNSVVMLEALERIQ
ncbi:hypothetical protein B0I71DRAFT_139341 [Yarrowia lipolytica]|uniref:Sm protein G n=1 Tax=Yarrowia lipolytica TaxID=4952 RepID=A0A371CB14_YARLL|nr:hypothetical protein B0I71DRAFT_139341 [Yarrowia lipolytica]